LYIASVEHYCLWHESIVALCLLKLVRETCRPSLPGNFSCLGLNKMRSSGWLPRYSECGSPHLNFENRFFLTVQPANRLFCIHHPHLTYLINWYIDSYLSMLDYSTARLLFNLNSIINTIRRKVALETIAKRVVVNIYKSYKFSKRKSCIKILLLSTNTILLLSFSIYIFSALSTTIAKLAITFYTIYWNIWYNSALIWQTIKFSTIFDYY